MDYHLLAKDFAQRTLVNLEAVEKLHKSNPGSVYEVTQTINSLLGLIVLPVEWCRDGIKEDLTPLDKMAEQGWPIPQESFHSKLQPHFCALMFTLRNSVAHSNMQFIAKSNGEIDGILFLDKDNNDQVRWRGYLSVVELNQLCHKLVGWIEAQP